MTDECFARCSVGQGGREFPARLWCVLGNVCRVEYVGKPASCYPLATHTQILLVKIFDSSSNMAAKLDIVCKLLLLCLVDSTSGE